MPVNRQQKITIVLVIMGICLLIIAGTYLVHFEKSGPPGVDKAFNPSGEFSLTGDNGKDFHLSDARGKVVLLFFGYTSCPDACPIALAKIFQTFNLLGADQEKVLTLFVSVDPQRDAPARLQEYLGYFGVNAVGLTGTREEIDSVVRAYHVYYQKVPGESAIGYTINHTTTIFLLDQRGRVRYLFKQSDTPATMAEVIRDIL